MIIQLPNGRIIECSLEQYLSLTDDEYKDLVNSDEQNNAYKMMDNMDLDKYTEHVEDL